MQCIAFPDARSQAPLHFIVAPKRPIGEICRCSEIDKWVRPSWFISALWSSLFSCCSLYVNEFAKWLNDLLEVMTSPIALLLPIAKKSFLTSCICTWYVTCPLAFRPGSGFLPTSKASIIGRYFIVAFTAYFKKRCWQWQSATDMPYAQHWRNGCFAYIRGI